MNLIDQLNYIKNQLIYIKTKVELDNQLGLYDINKLCEDIFMHMLNDVYGWSLKNANLFQENFPAIDLVDDINKLVIQVTSTTTSNISTQNEQQNVTSIVQEQNDLYRKFPGEKQISNLIFQHNGEYSFQISSWNNRLKAEAETRRLQNIGYNAFIVESYLSALKSTWYRVRIGFFKSEQEAIQYKMNNTF